MISGEEELTFSLLLEKFYVKAAKANMPMKPKLDFILQISDDVVEIKSRLDAIPSMNLIDNTKRDSLMKIVPKEMQIRGRKASEYLYVHISAINNKQSKFKHLGDDLWKRIAFEPSHKKDHLFRDSFKKWDHNAPNKKQILQVANDINSMQAENYEIFTQFTNGIKAVDEITANIATGSGSVNSLLDRLFLEKEDSEEFRKCIGDVVPILTEIANLQTSLFNNLRTVRSILKDYNRKRRKWADVLIGMRQTRTTSRKPVKPTIMSRLTNLATNAIARVRGMISSGNVK